MKKTKKLKLNINTIKTSIKAGDIYMHQTRGENTPRTDACSNNHNQNIKRLKVKTNVKAGDVYLQGTRGSNNRLNENHNQTVKKTQKLTLKTITIKTNIKAGDVYLQMTRGANNRLTEDC